MELKQVERLGAEISEAVFNPRAQILARIAFNCLARQAATGFGRD